MEQVKLSSLKFGSYFKIKDSETAPIWVRNHYDRPSKTYSVSRYDDVCHERFLKGSTYVFVL